MESAMYLAQFRLESTISHFETQHAAQNSLVLASERTAKAYVQLVSKVNEM